VHLNLAQLLLERYPGNVKAGLNFTRGYQSKFFYDPLNPPHCSIDLLDLILSLGMKIPDASDR
jgi:hypothetical protein